MRAVGICRRVCGLCPELIIARAGTAICSPIDERLELEHGRLIIPRPWLWFHENNACTFLDDETIARLGAGLMRP